MIGESEAGTGPETEPETEPDSETKPDEGSDDGSDEGSDDGSDDAPSGRSWLLRISALLALVALVFVAVSSWLWWQAAHDSSLELAQTRDSALIDARREVEVLTTLDYRDVDGGLERWLSVSTGPLNEQLSTVDDTAKQALADAAKVSTGTVVDAALTRVDVRAGTAAGIATVEISVTDESGESTVKRDRFTIELARVDGTWLVARLDQAPVGIA